MSISDEIIVVPAWRKDDPGLEADAVAFWQSEKILPPEIDPAERAKELVAIAYHEDQPVSVFTATVTEPNAGGNCFALYRVAVAEAYRRMFIMYRITRESLAILADWSVAHPEVRLGGLMTIFEADIFRKQISKGVSNNIPLVLIGYDDHGDEIRICWFDHVRV